MRTSKYLPLLFVSIGLAVLAACSALVPIRWGDDELNSLSSLRIGSLPALPANL